MAFVKFNHGIDQNGETQVDVVEWLTDDDAIQQFGSVDEARAFGYDYLSDVDDDEVAYRNRVAEDYWNFVHEDFQEAGFPEG